MEATSGPPRATAPIGVFDSGLGGLTVVAALQRALPGEDIVYLGDTARVPYGTRSGDIVRRYAKAAAHFLLERQAKLIVIACNTASAHALGDLQALLTVPVLGVVEAGAMAAAAAVQRGVLAVVATEGTVQSQAYQQALKRYASELEVVMGACPMLVPLAEEGLTNHPATRLLMQDYLRPILARRPAALLLGCTHYPVLLPLWRELCGEDVHILDSATAVAERVGKSLAEARLVQPNQAHQGSLTLYTTDLTARFRRTAALFLGAQPPEPQLCDLAAVPASASSSAP